MIVRCYDCVLHYDCDCHCVALLKVTVNDC